MHLKALKTIKWTSELRLFFWIEKTYRFPFIPCILFSLLESVDKQETRTANDCFYHWLICQILFQLMFCSIKHQRAMKNVTVSESPRQMSSKQAEILKILNLPSHETKKSNESSRTTSCNWGMFDHFYFENEVKLSNRCRYFFCWLTNHCSSIRHMNEWM